MSFNRENAVWRSPNGTWNLAFYTAHERFGSEDFDPEWDVDYDYESFEWLSRGFATADAAIRSWTGANPGCWAVTGEGDVRNVERLEAIAARYGTSNLA